MAFVTQKEQFTVCITSVEKVTTGMESLADTNRREYLVFYKSLKKQYNYLVLLQTLNML